MQPCSGALLLDLGEVDVGAILGTHAGGKPSGVAVELETVQGSGGVDVHADGPGELAEYGIGIENGGDGGIEGEAGRAKELDAIGLERVQHLLREAHVAEHAGRLVLDGGERDVIPGVVGDDVAAAEEFGIDADWVDVAVHAGGREGIGAVEAAGAKWQPT